MSINLLGQLAVSLRCYGKPSFDISKFIISLVAFWLVVLCGPLTAVAQTRVIADQVADLGSICLMIKSTARANALPLSFFARVIWQESRFRPDVIGPITRSGERAMGIAQFMPSTAGERHLLQPFDPGEALPKSGKFLADLRDVFGNLGLAAAAYNAGPQRVREFVAGSRGLPQQTRDYVLAISGRSVEAWAKDGRIGSNDDANNAQYGVGARNCHDLVAVLNDWSKSFAAHSPRRMVPTWCEHLHHPKMSVCGSVHQEELAVTASGLGKAKSHVAILRASTRR